MLRIAINQTRSIALAAWLGLRQGASAVSLSIGIIALSLTALGAFGIVVANVGRLSDAWARELTVTLFIKADAPIGEVDALRLKAARLSGVLDAVYVSHRQARTRLMQALGDRANLLSGLEDDVIPSAIELELVPGSTIEVVALLANTLKIEPIVDDVSWGAEELSRLGAVVSLLRIAGGVLGALIALVAILVISNTLKLTVLARRDEIAIMKLVGATDLFVRAPFVIEGAVQGFIGASLAGGLLVGLHQGVSLEVERVLSQAFGPVGLGGTPWVAVGVLVFVGTALGIVGGLVGVSRFLKV